MQQDRRWRLRVFIVVLLFVIGAAVWASTRPHPAEYTNTNPNTNENVSFGNNKGNGNGVLSGTLTGTHQPAPLGPKNEQKDPQYYFPCEGAFGPVSEVRQVNTLPSSSSMHRNLDDLLINPYTKKTYFHFPWFYLFPKIQVPTTNLTYLTTFDGIIVLRDWDCIPGPNKWGMRYYDFVPSRWIACDHQKAAFDKHQNEKLTGAEGEQSDGFLYTPPMPYFDEEYLEYTELLTSVMEARKTFTLIELGARWGTWCQRAWATIKNLRPGLEFHCTMVESDLEYAQWANEAILLNDLPNSTVIHGRADAPIVLDIIRKYELVDVIDFDIQEHEKILVPALFPEVSKNVIQLKIGIHSSAIFDQLTTFMKKQDGWELLEEPKNYGIYTECEKGLMSHDFDTVPRACLKESPFGPLYRRDGEIVYRNAKLLKTLKN